MVGYDYFLDATTLGLGIGAYVLTLAAAKEIQHILRSIGDKVQKHPNQLKELNVLFSEYIHAHAAIKQLSIVQCSSIRTKLVDSNQKEFRKKTDGKEFSHAVATFVPLQKRR